MCERETERKTQRDRVETEIQIEISMKICSSLKIISINGGRERSCKYTNISFNSYGSQGIKETRRFINPVLAHTSGTNPGIVRLFDFFTAFDNIEKHG